MGLRMEGDSVRGFDRTSSLEWLETNGLGGWASGTVAGAHTRRYHGLLVAATEPPVGRVVLLSKLDETLHVGEEAIALGCNRFPGLIEPHGYEHVDSFERDLFPVIEYRVGRVHLRKTVAAVHGENTTLILYDLIDAPQAVVLELRPFIAARDYHSLASANDAIGDFVDFGEGVLHCRPYAGGPELHILVHSSRFDYRPDWYYRFEYELERLRGLDFQEDLWTPGAFHLTLEKGGQLGVIVSTDDPAGRDPRRLLEHERVRRQRMVDGLTREDERLRLLRLAADQFIVRRGDDKRTVIAGYHWFGDWGRDTMIALPGLALLTRRFEDAKQILRAFAASANQGMLPNRFPDLGEEPEYNTVDATLWFFVAIHKYLEYSGDDLFVRDELLPVIRDILSWHDRGTRYGIRVGDDGLLWSGEPGVQLTWMDAKVGDWVVTPRHGKAVEVNALWYNALRVLAALERRFGDAAATAELEARAEKVRLRFTAEFWNGATGCLFDLVNEDGADPAIRPNQIFALSLPYPLLGEEKARSVLDVVGRELLTPVGLRSLSRDHPDYKPHYGGDPLSRDGAYHQGTVWGWLLGPYVTALVRLQGEVGRRRARKLLCQAFEHVGQACVGSFSEIFDAEPPHAPNGAVAQAWSVAEILRSWLEDVR